MLWFLLVMVGFYILSASSGNIYMDFNRYIVCTNSDGGLFLLFLRLRHFGKGTRCFVFGPVASCLKTHSQAMGCPGRFF